MCPRVRARVRALRVCMRVRLHLRVCERQRECAGAHVQAYVCVRERVRVCGVVRRRRQNKHQFTCGETNVAMRFPCKGTSPGQLLPSAIERFLCATSPPTRACPLRTMPHNGRARGRACGRARGRAGARARTRGRTCTRGCVPLGAHDNPAILEVCKAPAGRRAGARAPAGARARAGVRPRAHLHARVMLRHPRSPRDTGIHLFRALNDTFVRGLILRAPQASTSMKKRRGKPPKHQGKELRLRTTLTTTGTTVQAQFVKFLF